MGKVRIALIHNHDEQRNSYIQPHLARLRNDLSLRFEVESLAIANQPIIKPHGLAMSIFPDI